ncbi:TrkA family potassium uptake protein [Georgenia phoenicis]|uniref:potassium channel family protein n=1 Tax=unclassified Georgenia TaxID=2626815 RepID=UPI0039AF14DC
MRVVIAGAGSVGRSIARELLSHGHSVTLVDRQPAAMRIASVADAEWQLADACEISSLAEAGVASCDVVVAATGDDKANLVVSLLSKTEFGVPRVVARVNNPKNEWMFDAAWGVDVQVSTPRIMTALVEEAVSVGDLVRIFSFHGSGTSMHEVTLAPGSAVAGRTVRDVDWGPGCILSVIIRSGEPVPPDPDERIVAGDRLVLVLSERADPAALQRLVAPAPAAT